MEADPTKACDQDDATAFIHLNALRLKVAAKVQRRKRGAGQVWKKWKSECFRWRASYHPFWAMPKGWNQVAD
ncbi:MAG TPA: hypothetical protein VNT99_10340 [Methylomirabilota bacterium]|nr:hypothetical protein [Methylomirabilota bacterium]